MLFDVLVEGLPGQPLHDVAGKRSAVVGIGRRRTRREYAFAEPIVWASAQNPAPWGSSDMMPLACSSNPAVCCIMLRIVMGLPLGRPES